MNKQTEALKMAIEALSQDEGWFEPEAAIQACKEALEQPAKNIRDSFNEMLEDKVAYYKGKQPAQEPLTRAQQVIRANNSAQEPVAWLLQSKNKHEFSFSKPIIESEYLAVEPLYTHPAPSWQGLSDDDMSIIFDKFDWKEVEIAGEYLDLFKFTRAIEQTLKEKNSV